MLSKHDFLTRFLALGIVLLIAACSRSTNITNPSPFPDDTLRTCTSDEVTPDVDLLDSLSIISNTSADNNVSSLEIFPPFAPSERNYRAEVRELIDSVNVFALPVLADPSGDVRSVTMTINGSEVGFGQLSSLIELPLPRTAGSGGMVDPVQVLVELKAEVRLLDQVEDCDPGSFNLLEAIQVTQVYSVSLERAASGWGLVQAVSGSELVLGSVDPSSGEELDANIDGEAPLTSNDQFGSSVAIYDNTLAIGVPGDDNGDSRYFGVNRLTDSSRGVLLADLNQDNSIVDSGAVYIFDRQADGQWLLDQIIKQGQPGAGDAFGFSVALDRDVLAVSAPGEDSSGSGVNGLEGDNLAPESGAVYVYERQSFDPTWVRTSYIKPDSNVAGVDGFDDAFGYDIALNNGVLAVGAFKDDSAGPLENTGSVSIYNQSSNWNFGQRLLSPIVAANTRFGLSIDMVDDSLLVGAPGDSTNYRGVVIQPLESDWFNLANNNFDFSRSSSGASYYFGADAGVWSIKAYLKADNADLGDEFGSSVAISSFGEFVVGAPHEDGSGAGLNRNMDSNDLVNSGAAYRYKFSRVVDNSSGLSLESVTVNLIDYVKQATPSAGVLFADNLAMDGTLLVVGASQDIASNPDRMGSVDVYSSRTNNLTLLGELSYVDALGSVNERFSASLSISNGRIAVGAPGAGYELLDSSGSNPVGPQLSAGLVTVYE